MTPLEILDYIIDHEERNLILFSHHKENIETLKWAKDCIKFVTHIQNHLVDMGKPTEKVICKICGKTVGEIAGEFCNCVCPVTFNSNFCCNCNKYVREIPKEEDEKIS